MISNELRTERLNKLADFLENQVVPLTFDMGTFGTHIGTEDPRIIASCGTAACALGHAAYIKEFQDAGLSIIWAPNDWQNQEAVRTGDKNAGHYWWGRVKYEDYSDEEAGAMFFGLSYPESEDLFYGGGDRESVIAKIRELAKYPAMEYDTSDEDCPCCNNGPYDE